MNPKLIKTDAQHQAALSHIESLMDAKTGSAKEDELELWAMLVEQYEQAQFPIGDPDPVEAIRFRMDQMGLRQKDLVECIGAKSKVSEVLSGKRQLSLPMIRALHEKLDIPAEVLVKKVRFSAKMRSRKKPGKVGV